jgi:threonine/homoserine/homoserine lactone efflux protein
MSVRTLTRAEKEGFVGQAIGEILAPAVGVALSPMPIVAVILMLFTPKARSTGTAFAAGWVFGLIVVVGIVLLVANPADLADGEDNPSTMSSVIHLVLGLLLVLLAFKQWQGRPKGDEEPEMPKWMQSIDKITPVMAFAFGALMSGINPKNLIFDIAAGTSIAQADLSTGNAIVVLLVFTVVASSTVAGVVIWYLMAGNSAEAKLTDLKGWLTRNNAVVMAVLLLVLGVSQVGKGIGGLFA